MSVDIAHYAHRAVDRRTIATLSGRVLTMGAVIIGVLAMAAMTAACGTGNPTTSAEGGATADVRASNAGGVTTAELVESLQAAGFGTFASAVDQLGVETLLESESFTILAPDDDAFLALTSDDVADLLADPDRLRRALLNHVINERLSDSDLRRLTSVTTAGGTTFDVVVDGGTLLIGGGVVSPEAVPVGTGVALAIDKLFVP